MQRVMIIGQPGSGKSTLARWLGERTGLPVVHIDKIHWKPGWVERDPDERAAMIQDVHDQEFWIFEGGNSQSYDARLTRADTLIWLDVSLGVRLARVFRRAIAGYGRTRPDMQDDCPEQLGLEFLRFLGFIWRTRNTSRNKMQKLYDRAPTRVDRYCLVTTRDVDAYLQKFD